MRAVEGEKQRYRARVFECGDCFFNLYFSIQNEFFRDKSIFEYLVDNLNIFAEKNGSQLEILASVDYFLYRQIVQLRTGQVLLTIPIIAL